LSEGARRERRARRARRDEELEELATERAKRDPPRSRLGRGSPSFRTCLRELVSALALCAALTRTTLAAWLGLATTRFFLVIMAEVADIFSFAH